MSYVYFVRHRVSGFIKIGFSENPTQRMRSLGKNVLLLKIIKGDRSTEGNLHAKFSAQRVRGEWFRNCAEIQDYMMSRPSVSKLPAQKYRHRSILFNETELALLDRVAEEEDTDVSKLVRRLVRGYVNSYLKSHNGGKSCQ